MANTAVFGIYASRAQVEAAVEQLSNAGFRATDISLLLPENLGTKDLVHEKHTKAPEGAVAGGTSGALVGGVLGTLVGIGALAIPGVGPLIAAGPIVAALTGVGAGAALGGIAGALVGLGIPEYEAKRYAGLVKEGGILLSVHADDREWTKRAREVLQRTGADHIASTSEANGDYANAERPGTRPGATL
jgi:hypothetical protein